jgi:hypothetical protein
MSQQSGEASGAALSVRCAGDTAQNNVPTGNADSKFGGRCLTALGERDALVRDAERRAGESPAGDECRRASFATSGGNWCGSGVTVRGEDPLRRLDGTQQESAMKTRRMSAAGLAAARPDVYNPSTL